MHETGRIDSASGKRATVAVIVIAASNAKQ